MKNDNDKQFSDEVIALISEQLDPVILNLSSYSVQDLENLLEQSITNAKLGITTSREIMTDVHTELDQIELIRDEISRRLGGLDIQG